MKKFLILFAFALMLVLACGKKSAPPPPYAEDSLEFQFFKTLSEKVPALDPAKMQALITTKDFDVYNGDIMPFLYARLSRYANNLDQVPMEEVKQMVKYAASYEAEKQLLVNEAIANKVTVSEDTLQAQLTMLFERAGGEEKFFEIYSKQGLTKEYILKDIKNSLLIRDYLENVLYKDIEPTEQDLLDEYNKDKTATVQHILLTTQGKTDEEKKEIYTKTEEILKRAKADEDFGALAKEFSEDPGSKDKGGLYENFPKGTMVKPFEEASFNLPIGSISDIVETDYGYHIIKVISRGKEDRPFEEIKEALSRNLAETKKRDVEEKILEDLKVKKQLKEVDLEAK